MAAPVVEVADAAVVAVELVTVFVDPKVLFAGSFRPFDFVDVTVDAVVDAAAPATVVTVAAAGGGSL